jgi:hypothetical protein
MKIRQLFTPSPAQLTSGTTPVYFIVSGAMDFDNFGIQVLTEGGAITGTWTVEVSNDYVNQIDTDSNNNTGHWIDCSSLLNTAFTAVAAVGSQYRQLVDFCGKALRVVFTPATGTTTATVFIEAKSNG